MAKSRTEMMELLANLLVEYAEFQRRRPDLSRTILIQRHRDFRPIERGPARHLITAGYTPGKPITGGPLSLCPVPFKSGCFVLVSSCCS